MSPSNVKLDNPLSIQGSWKGFEFPKMPEHLKHMRLPELFEQVRQAQPDYLETSEIQRASRDCRAALLKTTLTNAQIQALLTFEGNEKELFKLCRSAYLEPDLTLQLEYLRSQKVQRLWDLLKGGALGFEAKEVWHQFNKILDAYTTTQSLIMRGIGGVNDTLEVQSVAVGAGYSVPATDQTALDHQLGADKVPDASVLTGYQTTFLTAFLPADSNGASTTVATATDTTHFTLTSATGFSLGDRVMLTGTGLSASGEKRTIAALSGVNVTLDTALSIMPPVGAVVLQIWGESGLRINGNSVLGTRSRLSDGGFAKTNTNGIFIESAVTLRIVGS